MLEKAGKHVFVDMWMGGARTAVYGGEISPVSDMISGALSSVGNGFINENMDGIVLKTASSAVLGGTISDTNNFLNKNSNLTVFISSSYLTDPDNTGLLYDAVDHELVHVGDYSSGRAIQYRQNYKLERQVTIMDYKAYSENLWYNTHVDINRSGHNQYVQYYRKQVNTYKAGLPGGWSSIK